ncbi:MAG: AMP-binding protein [Desulfarculus sp.]|nr:MAG: AMP-binding protein [Desulfarculus sp.]
MATVETLGAALKRAAAEHGGSEAVMDLPSGWRLTYAELDQAAAQLARGLMALGLEPGERLGLWAPNQPEWIITLFAAAKAGLVLTSVDTSFGAAELAYQLKQSRCRALVLTPGIKGAEYLQALAGLCPQAAQPAPEGLHCPEFPELKWAILIGQDAPPGVLTWSRLLELAQQVEPAALAQREAAVRPGQAATLLYTSGTTGRPKGVLSPHRGLVVTSTACGNNQRLSPQDRLVVSVPLCHMFGCICVTLSAVLKAATLVIPSRLPEPAAILRAVVAEGCTALYGPPTSFIALMDEPSYQQAGGGLRTGIMAGAQVPLEVMRKVVQEMGVNNLIGGYGQTEASSWISLSSPEDSLERRAVTVGRPVPGAQVMIVDPGSGQELPLGQVGEICVRGHVMLGYFDMPAETAAALDPQGWLHTGDLGSLDAEGYISISGRLKEAIRKGGKIVFPAEVEQVLFSHPKINNAQVFGVPHDVLGEEVACWIKLEKGQKADLAEIMEFLRRKLPANHLPAHLKFVEAFPMTPLGKIQKFKMREAFIAERQGRSAS